MSKNLLVVPPSEFGRYLEKNHYPLWLAINHHRTHTNKSMTLKNHAYLKEVLMDKNPYRVYKKSTQGGISECLIMIAYSAAIQGSTVFYVLPTHQLMERFVSNRFEKSMAFSPYYRSKRSSGKSKEYSKDIIDNRSLKDVGLGVINFAGSGSDVPFVEIPADWLIVDEADNCDAGRLEMAKERLGHSSDPHEIYVGNPTFLGSFLDKKFSESTMSRWHIHHDCGHWINIDFFQHVVKEIGDKEYIIRDEEYEPSSGYDIRPICDKCGKPFDRFEDGTFIDFKQSHISGKQMSRVFSGTSPLFKMVDKFSEALENDYKMQRFYNSELGESYVSTGAKIDDGAIFKCAREYLMPDSCSSPCAMGIDVGIEMHVVINQLLPDHRRRVVFTGTVREAEEIYELWKQYNCKFGVVDAHPETRLAKKLCAMIQGMAMCLYINGVKDSVDKQKVLRVDRTSSLDEVKEVIALQTIEFPKNVMQMKNFTSHLKASTRIFDEKSQLYKWVETGPDHYAHAMVYALKAEKLIYML